MERRGATRLFSLSAFGVVIAALSIRIGEGLAEIFNGCQHSAELAAFACGGLRIAAIKIAAAQIDQRFIHRADALAHASRGEYGDSRPDQTAATAPAKPSAAADSREASAAAVDAAVVSTTMRFSASSSASSAARASAVAASTSPATAV